MKIYRTYSVSYYLYIYSTKGVIDIMSQEIFHIVWQSLNVLLIIIWTYLLIRIIKYFKNK